MNELEIIQMTNNIHASTLNIVIDELKEVSELKCLQKQKNFVSKWQLGCAIRRLETIQGYLKGE